jgi:hypothetical protein
LAIVHLGAEDCFRTLRAYKNAAADVQYFDFDGAAASLLSVAFSSGRQSDYLDSS